MRELDDAAIKQSLDAVQNWVEKRDYKGYDPGDGLTSFLRPLTFGHLFAERLLQQLIWKSPVNIRPLIGVVPLPSTKGRGFMAWGYLFLHKALGTNSSLDKAMQGLRWLDRNRESGQVGHSWGNYFDFSTRGGCMKARTPTIVWSGLIGQAFLEAYEQTGEPEYLDISESICQWILNLPRESTPEGSCLSYTGVGQSSVHNSNLLGAGMLSRTWKHRNRDEYRKVAREAVLYSCTRQRPDGSWWYAERPTYHWIDNFHTAYNLDSLKRYIESTGDESFRENLNRGYDYFKRTFFEPSGRPRYYHKSTYPIDIQCASQAIDTFCFFAAEDPEALSLAERVARWTIENMQDRKGYFYYRQYPLLTAKTPYFHWGQATMFKALAHLLFVRSANATKSPNGSVLPVNLPESHGKLAHDDQEARRGVGLKYALITPARNEKAYIASTIRSVVSQTVLPSKWIIVSDGSTDGTDEIVKGFLQEHPWIELLRMPERHERQFAAKAHAFNAGCALLGGTAYDIIGNLDADITFEPDYFEFLLGKFASDPNLGVAGTPFVEDQNQLGKHTYAHQFAHLQHVSGACQLFRRSCFESVGGYQPVKGGAIDWIAVTTARMNGWKTRTFTEKVCLHHRSIGTGNNSPLMVPFHYGRKAYYVGGHPLWEMFRGIFQMKNKPRLIGGLFFQLGYVWAFLSRVPRAVSPELMNFHRAEQMSRLNGFWIRLWGRKITRSN
ncbi:MAG TPA: glycosyltransferase [Terrimicrobiaceae bacterium]